MRCYLIVGAGLAGATAALRLRAEGFDGRVVLIGDEPHPPYSRPPLSKAVVRGEVPPERTRLRPAGFFEKREIEILSGVAVTDLDLTSRSVGLDAGSRLAYDALLLATGGRARTLPGCDDIPGVYVLRTLEDAEAIRERLGPGRSLLVVGGGFIGAELAASARMRGSEVAVLEAEPLPLSRVLPPSVARIYAQIHRERGVTLHTGVAVTRIENRGELRAIGSDGRAYPADAIVVAIGLVPNQELAAKAGLAVGDGILVDERCRTSAPGVYAAGDVANHPNPILGRRIRVEHWQNAQHQGAAAACNMLGREQIFAEVPWVWSDQYELNLQVAGLPEPSDQVVMRGNVAARCFTALMLRDGALVAAIGVNRPDDVHAARRLIAVGARPDPARLAADEEPLELPGIGEDSERRRTA